MNRMMRYRQEEEEFNKPLNMGELKAAINQADVNKKSGVDEMEVAMFKNMNDDGLKTWLEVMNESWRMGVCPGSWKKAEIIPILKSGKDPKDINSYGPVSLTSVAVKILERMITNRLYYWMEKTKVINNWQAGFQRGRSTEEQVLRMVQEIHDGYEEKNGHLKTVAVTIDCSKAYDRVWKTRLMERMMEEKVPSPIVRWINSFIEGRQACVRVGSSRSKWKKMKEGLPQGAVSSPALFLFYANDWSNSMEEEVSYSGFADDVAMWTTGREVNTLRDRMQRAVDKAAEWAKINRIELNPKKSEVILFTRNQAEKDKDLKIVIDGKKVEMKKEILFLGIHIDQNLCFKGQVEKVGKKVRERTKVLRAIAGKEWGCHRKEMKKVYKAVVESVFWYSSSAWMPWLSKSNLIKLETAQREALRVVCGLTKTTPSEIVYLEAEEVPISVEARRRAMYCFEKAMRCEGRDPRTILCEKRIEKRLKDNKGWREYARAECEKLDLGPRAEMNWKRGPPWNTNMEEQLELRDSLIREAGDNNDEKRRVAEETLEGLKDREVWLFTDGSVEGGIMNGGAACVGRKGEDQWERKAAAGRWCSSFAAEVRAMELACDVIEEVKPESVAVMTDSQALVRTLGSTENRNNQKIVDLKERLRRISDDRNVVIQWVPSHVGIDGNEWADRAANEARNCPQANEKIWLEAAKRKIAREVGWKPELDERTRRVYAGRIRKVENAGRKDEVILAQIRAGHCPKMKGYRKRIGASEDGMCDLCNEEEEEKDHFMFCSALDAKRREHLIVELDSLADEGRTLGFLKDCYPSWWQK